MKKNLDKSVIYNVYPTSFYDSNGDGIGDIKGITQKLQYIKNIADIIWINPVFLSPFKDGGYDIVDFYSIDKKFGTMQDLKELLLEAKRLGIKVLLDLVIGHTSDKHKWFKASQKAKRNKYTDYYIWTDGVYKSYPNYNLITGNSERDGSYMLNAFYCQPALNFGFAKVKYSWQFHYEDEVCINVRNEVVKIIEYYLEMGVSGFRCDMAGVLVKDDDGTCSAKVWKYIFSKVREKYPDAIFISEWGEPYKSVIKDCFDLDFFTHCYNIGYTNLFRGEKGSNVLDNDWDSYFRKTGRGECKTFFDYLEMNNTAVKDNGYVCIPSSNHDLPRISYMRDYDDMKTVFSFLLAIKCVPLIYYGDEIAIPYENITSKDGGYVRTGSRTPMLWNNEQNNGFSTTESKKLYLPILNNGNKNSVEEQQNDKNSLYNTVLELLDIRRKISCLGADANMEVVSYGYPMIIKRYDDKLNFYAIINPSANDYSLEIDGEILSQNKCEIKEKHIVMHGASYCWLLSNKELKLY